VGAPGYALPLGDDLVIDDGLDEGDLGAVVRLVDGGAVVAKEGAVVDAHEDAFELLVDGQVALHPLRLVELVVVDLARGDQCPRHQLPATVHAVLVVEQRVLQQVGEDLLLERHLVLLLHRHLGQELGGLRSRTGARLVLALLLVLDGLHEVLGVVVLEVLVVRVGHEGAHLLHRLPLHLVQLSPLERDAPHALHRGCSRQELSLLRQVWLAGADSVGVGEGLASCHHIELEFGHPLPLALLRQEGGIPLVVVLDCLASSQLPLVLGHVVGVRPLHLLALGGERLALETGLEQPHLAASLAG